MLILFKFAIFYVKKINKKKEIQLWRKNNDPKIREHMWQTAKSDKTNGIQKRDLTNNEIKIIQFAKKINNSGSDQGFLVQFWRVEGVIPVAVMTTPQTMVLTIMDLEITGNNSIAV